MNALRLIESLSEVEAAAWNALSLGGVPFLRHEFLLALETTGCVGESTGWKPRHLTLWSSDNQLLAAVPLYEKTHSWGEFVFDFSWAQAYQRYGDRYYPKLVSASPYTPATAARLLIHPAAPRVETTQLLIQGLEDAASHLGASSVHVQFPTEAEALALARSGWLSRIDCQFHWKNQNYRTFEDFLATFTAEKRKKAKRERRRVAEMGIRFEIRDGASLSHQEWQTVYALKASTFHRHGHEPYLNLEFFLEISSKMPESLRIILALHENQIVATAICFQGEHTLYGRYWGAAAELHSLHFETCYYQGIEYAIAAGLSHFEPGTQGEHKIARGFSPTTTHSSHYIADPAYRKAIGDHLRLERASVRQYMEATEHHTPFKHEPAELSLDS